MTDKHTPQQPAGPAIDPQEIIRYTSGQMSDAEAQALEARALEDPFLADALEGVDQVTDKVRLEQMAYALNQDLKRRLSGKRKKNRWIGFEMPGWFPWVILILLILITTIFLYIRKLGG
ncbi:MAG: hypothetical protein ACKO6Q_08070 [Bacteroidota bacterium]